MEDNVTGEQPDLGPYCLQYKLHKYINRLGKLNNGSFGKKS